MMQDTYKAILDETETLIIEKKSKFICNIKPIDSEEEALLYILDIKKKHYSANHHCSAFIISAHEGDLERSNDDKEPTGTAGKPMMEVLRGEGLKNVVAVVTRYFGGTLLGTGGLIKAYTQSIKSCIEEASIYEKILCVKLRVETDYSSLPKIEYEVHQLKQKIYETIYSDHVSITLLLERNVSEPLQEIFMNATNGQCKLVSEGLYYVAEINNKFILEDTCVKNFN